MKTRHPHRRCCTWSRERSQADKAKATQVEDFGVKKVLETQLPKPPSTPENKQALLVPPPCLQPPRSCCPQGRTTRLAPEVDLVAHGASQSHQYAVCVCVAGQDVCWFFLQPLETSAKENNPVGDCWEPQWEPPPCYSRLQTGSVLSTAVLRDFSHPCGILWRKGAEGAMQV